MSETYDTIETIALIQGRSFDAIEIDQIEGDVRLIAGDRAVRLYHDHDCCETFEFVDVIGDLSDLVGVPIVSAQMATRSAVDCDVRTQWTFVLLRTSKGDVTLRWVGSTDGPYALDVDVYETHSAGSI